MSLSFKPGVATSRRAKVLLIGEPGVGKTHAALTFPKCAVIDAEGSIDWFADRVKFTSVQTKSYTDVRALIEAVRTGKVECETLVIDSLTTVYNALLNAAVSARLKDGKEDLRPIDWGRIKRKFSQMLDELYHKLPVNVVCVGWIKPEYAKPGSRWNGKTISENDLVKIGEQFDGDRKASYAFDFVFKILDNDGKRTRAEVIKTRSGKLKTGQVIEDFSYKTLAALMPGGVVAPQGMTDDEASDKDVGDAVVDPPAKVHRDVEDNEANRGKAIQMIHIEAQKVGLDTKDKDPTTPYRKMLADYFHVDSSKDLALPQLQELYRMVRQYGREHVHA